MQAPIGPATTPELVCAVTGTGALERSLVRGRSPKRFGANCALSGQRLGWTTA